MNATKAREITEANLSDQLTEKQSQILFELSKHITQEARKGAYQTFHTFDSLGDLMVVGDKLKTVGYTVKRIGVKELLIDWI